MPQVCVTTVMMCYPISSAPTEDRVHDDVQSLYLGTSGHAVGWPWSPQTSFKQPQADLKSNVGLDDVPRLPRVELMRPRDNRAESRIAAEAVASRSGQARVPGT